MAGWRFGNDAVLNARVVANCGLRRERGLSRHKVHMYRALREGEGSDREAIAFVGV